MRPDWEGVWAANGSNEVMLHVLQAFGGPGRACLSFTPTYSMYPEYARDTLTDYVKTGDKIDYYAFILKRIVGMWNSTFFNCFTYSFFIVVCLCCIEVSVSYVYCI